MAENDEILARIAGLEATMIARFDQYHGDINTLFHAVEGNGSPGLKHNVAVLQQQVKDLLISTSAKMQGRFNMASLLVALAAVIVAFVK